MKGGAWLARWVDEPAIERASVFVEGLLQPYLLYSCATHPSHPEGACQQDATPRPRQPRFSESSIAESAVQPWHKIRINPFLLRG